MKRAIPLQHTIRLLFVAAAAISAPVAIADEAVRFSRDVRPILAEHCFRCHGPDEQQRQAELRLDQETDAKRSTDGRAAVVPGRLDQSELWQRITAAGEDRMPPPDAGALLTADQISILRRWIEEGAAWEGHWSFSPPTRPALPVENEGGWARNPIDLFIADQRQRRGLSPSPAADKETLLRRVTLDLTGLPPTLDEIDAFLADDSPNAYEKVVDRLLASPRHGERMAWMWLEAARYADTSGYQNDGPRSMWRWRDWVIDAFNSGMPFDQFTVEQLAGDLLPTPTLEQLIATGFNRNHRGNSEGGIIPEEYQVEYVADRVDTTSTVWLALTMGCARCHDHKFDPVTQRDFYSFFAYFNNIPEYGRAIKEGNSPPLILAPTREQQRSLKQVEGAIADAERQWKDLADDLDKAQSAWEASLSAVEPATPIDWFLPNRVAHFSFEPSAPQNPAWKTIGADAARESGLVGDAIRLDGQQYLDAGDAGNFGYFDRFSVGLWLLADHSPSGALVSRMSDEEQGDGWSLRLEKGHVQFNLVKRWLDDAVRVETKEPLPRDTWVHLVATYDGSRRADGLRIYINGQVAPLDVRLDLLNQSFAVSQPLRIGRGGGPTSHWAGAFDEIQIFDRVLSATEIAALAVPEPIERLVKVAPSQRTPGQQAKVRDYFIRQAAPRELQAAFRQLQDAREQHAALLEQVPTVMVMREMERRRPTHLLVRGEYNRPGEQVEPALPGSLAKRKFDSQESRLDLAGWIVSPENPLTARVLVNRLWQLHFGAGLVRTTEDFGLQGEPPSHPELLDWLAVEWTGESPDRGSDRWDVKALHRLLVTSATYRQSSAHRDGAGETAVDPENRWYARGPRQRLSAEMIRDQALAASGLLAEQLGGPSVKTYQPADLWKDLATDSIYEQDHGASLYRRSLYIYWKRTVAPPSMMNFDAAGREACQVRTPRTNTPLQALTLMNEVTFVEAARVLAERVMAEADTADDRLLRAFRLVTGRRPLDRELAVVSAASERHLEFYQQDLEAARKLVSHGEYPRGGKLEVAELAAYAATCNLLLNLDEVVTRQ